MRNPRQIIQDGDAHVAGTSREGSYRGQVIVTNRSYTEPIVLFECRHRHRRVKTAQDCAQEWIDRRA